MNYKNLIKKLSVGVASLALVTPLVLGGMNVQSANARVTPFSERPNANGALKSSVDFISPRKAYNQGIRDGIKDARYYNTHNGIEVKPIHGFTGTADGILEVHGRVIDAKSVAKSKREYKVDYSNWLKGYTRSYDQHEHDGVKFGVNGHSVTTFGTGPHLSQGHEKATNVRKNKNTVRKHAVRRNHNKHAKRNAKKYKTQEAKRTRRHTVHRNSVKKLLKRNRHYNKKIRQNTKKRRHKNYLPRKFFGKWYARRGYLGVIKQASGFVNIDKNGDYVKLPFLPPKGAYVKFNYHHGTYSDDVYNTDIKLINHGKTLHVFNGGSGYPLNWYMHRV